MPSKQCVGGDEAAVASWLGECGGDRSEQRSVIVVEGWPVGLSAEDLDLMAEHDDLEVLGATGTDSEAGQGSDEAVENARHSRSASPAFRLVNPHDRIFRPPQGFPAF